MRRRLIWLAIGGALALCAYSLTPISYGVGLSIKYELPAGFKGWMLHRDRDPSCPPITRSGIYWVVKVADDGIACTSEPLPRKARYYIFEYVDAAGNRVKVKSPWGHTLYRGRQVTAQTNVATAEDEIGAAWFIGTEDELKRAGYTYKPIERSGVQPHDRKAEKK
jgi:hypothetical protein